MSKKSRRLRAVREEAHFVEVGAKSVKSTRGFEVAIIGRFELLYQEGDRRVVVPIDRLVGRILVELSRVKGWLPPHDDEVLSDRKRSEISKNIGASMSRLRIGYEIQ